MYRHSGLPPCIPGRCPEEHPSGPMLRSCMAAVPSVTPNQRDISYAQSGLLCRVSAVAVWRCSLRAKGLSEPLVILVHVLRNSMIPVVALGLPTTFAGAINQRAELPHQRRGRTVDWRHQGRRHPHRPDLPAV